MRDPFIATLKAGILIGLAGGFIAGKIDLDEKIKTAIHNQNVKLGRLNARLLVDEIIERKALTSAASTD